MGGAATRRPFPFARSQNFQSHRELPMNNTHTSGLPPSLPPLVISSRDMSRLEALLDTPVLRRHPAALALMDELIVKQEFRVDMDLQPGDIQLVNNYSVLHARTAYEDYDEPERWRLLLRLWLNLPEARPPENIARFTRRGFADVVQSA